MKYVKPLSSSEIAPLYQADGSITSDKEDQAELLFHGTSVAHIDADLADIPPERMPLNRDPRLDSIPLIAEEIDQIITDLPTGKAKGPDQIANEIVKIAYPVIAPLFLNILNTCFELGHFPNPGARPPLLLSVNMTRTATHNPAHTAL